MSSHIPNGPVQMPPPRRGFFVNVGSLVAARGVLAVSQILVLPILARMLTIDDFALMAMAMSLIVFCSVLSDAGLGRSLIRTPNFDHDEWSTVFWFLLVVGIGLWTLVLLLSPFWSAYFSRPDLTLVLAGLAFVPFLQAISAVPNADLERREHYTGIARIQMLATIASLSTAVVLAFAGAGVWALVGQQIALAGVRMVGIFWLSEFRPRIVFRGSVLGPHLIFARDALLVAAITAVRGQTVVVTLGKLLGDAALGIFSMTERFLRLPQFGLAGPMSAVVYVRMAKAQSDPERMVDIYLAALRLLALALAPGLAMVAVTGETLFAVLLSEKWGAVAPVFALAIPGLAFEAITIVNLACIFRALARTDLMVRQAIEGTVLRAMLVLAASFISLEAVAISLSVWGILYVPRCWALAARIVPLRGADCLATISAPVAAAAIAAVAHSVVHATWQLTAPKELVLAVLFGAVATLAAWLTTRSEVTRAIAVLR